MQITDIVDFWRGKQHADDDGCWAHELDRTVLASGHHTFNIDYPVSPYVGDIQNAPVVILGANARYDRKMTPSEFPSQQAVDDYLKRVDQPSASDWSFVSRYYDQTNYGHLVSTGQAALINACAYRSPKLSKEPENQRMIRMLPSCKFTRRWLIEALFGLAEAGDRLIVVKRGGQWRLPSGFESRVGVARDPAPVSPYITSAPLSRLTSFLAAH